MKFERLLAYDGHETIKVNEVHLYSKYKPLDNVIKWIDKEFDSRAEAYILIGLGLGYHLNYLLEKTKKEIYVLYFSEDELNLVEVSSYKAYTNVYFVKSLPNHILHGSTQILLPTAWVQIMRDDTKIHGILDTIKRNQISYRKFGNKMELNALENLRNYIPNTYPTSVNKVACLISSGPSLNKTLPWLKNKLDIDIFVVGSALKTLLNKNIQPYATVITDAQDYTKIQLEGTNYQGNLYYLLTSNFKAVNLHAGEKYLMCQEGHELAERVAEEFNLPKLPTGGSVATTTFSLIEYLGYKKLVLFGQDLGFEGQSTHAEGSTSGKNVTTNLRVKANDGTMINTQPNLQVYHRWFNEACQQTSMQVYNTAQKGAAITNVPLITEEQFKGL